MNRKKSLCFLIGGVLLIAAGLLLTLYNLWDARRAEREAEAAVQQLERFIPAAEDGVDLPADGDMPEVRVDGQLYIGTLEIPSQQLVLPVISEWSYPNLRIAPCRYQGSAYTDDLILAAHNYSTHFGGLSALVPGDEVRFTDMNGNVFCYAVQETVTLQPTALEAMTAGDWDLTLFTCTYGGQSRVTVRCQRLETE